MKRIKKLITVNELKNRLMGIVAHDLRSPIFVTYSYS